MNCTGAALGSTRRVLQANGVYITEQLQNLTLTHPKDSYRKGTHPEGTLSQVVISTDPDVYDEGTWTYYDYAHLSDIQVYHNVRRRSLLILPWHCKLLRIFMLVSCSTPPAPCRCR